MIMKGQLTMHPLEAWRLKGMGILRIIFGVVWLDGRSARLGARLD